MVTEGTTAPLAPIDQSGHGAGTRPPQRRHTRPDPELLWALCKGVWSTLFTIVTLSAVIFVCSHVEPRDKHERAAGVARHD